MAELITRFLGTISPTLEWQFFPVASQGSENYLLTFAGDLENYRESILLQARYRDNSVAGYRRFWPDSQPRNFEFPIPEIYEATSFTGLIWGVRRRTRGRVASSEGPTPITVTLREITGVD